MSKMTMLMMGRNYILRTIKGHTIRFKANVPKAVPPDVVEDAMRFGAFPTDPDKVAQEQADTDRAPEPDTTPRPEKIKRAMREMMEANNREDFNATGRPDIKKLQDRAGIDSLSAKERDEIFDQLAAEMQQNGD